MPGRYSVSRAKMKINVRGKTYPNAATCAKALRVSVATVYSAVARNRTDTLGLGRGNRSVNRGGTLPKPVTIGPLSFSSQRAASRELGCHPAYVGNVLRRGSYAARADLVARVYKLVAAREKKERAQREHDDMA